MSREGGGHSPFAKGGRSRSSVERGGCSPFVREGALFVERGGRYLLREGAVCVKGRLFAVCQFVERAVHLKGRVFTICRGRESFV